jgi:UDP-N-acetylmuramate dehydrogenase
MFKKNFSLKSYNTFGLDTKAKRFVSVESLDQLKEVLSLGKDVFVLSGGSNVLFTQDLKKPVVHLNLKGITIVRDEEGEDIVRVRAMAGENWHDFVIWSIERGYGGLENLSLIPGNVGTSPMQNIGAYGVEIKDLFFELEALELATGETRLFDKEQCAFGYRESVFKNELKGKYIITSVTFELNKRNHTVNTSYGAIQSELDKKGIRQPSIREVSEVVIAIRQSKLPDPSELGNSGSFFKNPVISASHFKGLQKLHTQVPHYRVSDHWIKVPAGWLVEQSGFKGKRYGDAGVHEKQALVLVNHGKATGKEILQLAKLIQKEVNARFDISLEMEVNII